MKLKMSLKSLLCAVTIGLIVLAGYSANQSDEPFAPAAVFPREGALVYVQIEDLPAFTKLWNESDFKSRYAQSEHFAEFQNSHLGRKIVSRWREFGDAAGFSIDLETAAELAQNKAALGIYDVGKLEFVFTAAVGGEVFAATKFALNRDKFQAQTFDEQTTVYRVNVEADRGRQNQELIFCYAKGRFILATSEKLMAQTLQNLSGANAGNALSNAPEFSALKDRITPHLAAVWVNQAALNKDYYFRNYWLMPETEKLKNIRAGIFDLEIKEDKIIENRHFLLESNIENQPVERTEAARLTARLPENIPFYQLRTAAAETLDGAVEKTFFERVRQSEKKRKNYFSGASFFGGSNDFESADYKYLESKFDETIDDNDDEDETSQIFAGSRTPFSDILRSARVRSVLTFTKPQILPPPLFLRFDRAAVFYLAAPEKFDRQDFEREIMQRFARQTMIAAPGVRLEWQTVNENNLTDRRTLSLPMLGISASYIVRGNEMILSDNADLLSEILAADNLSQQLPENDFTSLSVINLDEKNRAYNDVFTLLAEKKAANGFFSGNVKSFITAVDGIKRIEISARYDGKFLEEHLAASR